MDLRYKLLTATAAAALWPCGLSLAQAASAPVSPAAPALSADPAASQAAPAPPDGPGTPPQPGVNAATLPQAPSSLLAGSDTGLVRPAGSGVRYVAPGTMTGPGGFLVEKATDGVLPLSLDDAISLGLARNVSLRYQKANQQLVRGYTGQVTNALIPNLNFKAASSAQEINLVGLGFKPALVAPLLATFGLTGGFPTIVKVNTTSVQMSLDQVLFNMPDFELFRAIKPEERSIDKTVEDVNEQVVQAVTQSYLQVLSDQANLQNTIAQETAAKVLLDQAVSRDTAGVGIKLDVLRAQVEYQQRQQAHVSAEAQLDKDGIQLNRMMGIPAGQQLDLTDDAPFSELADMDLEQAKQTAYTHRPDLQSVQAQLEVAGHEVHAVKYQRLPTLGVNGFYGILGQDTGTFHGVFAAEGSLRFPVFREAAQRGEEQAAGAQLQTLKERENDLRGAIEAQIRNSLLDINSSDQLVRVAQSNVQLAQQELSDARDRFTAGVTDNLEVVDAQATLTGAEAQLVRALYQYNVAKVSLARSTGVLQTRYRAFLGM